jgi:hypothetical protein
MEVLKLINKHKHSHYKKHFTKTKKIKQEVPEKKIPIVYIIFFYRSKLKLI